MTAIDAAGPSPSDFDAKLAREAAMSRSSAAIHLLATAALGAVVVTSSPPGNLVILAIWAILVVGWVKRRALANGWRAGIAEQLVQIVAMSAIVLAAIAAPVKTIDRRKARLVTLPKQAMTVGELRSPHDHGLTWPFAYHISSPDDLAVRLVRFPARELTVEDFIRAIEGETPLRHYFGHCGNGGSSILWGKNCAFGLIFDVPHRKAAP